MKKECHICGNYLMLGIIIKTGEEVLVCDDDESLYRKDRNGKFNCNYPFHAMSYLESQGLEPTWDSIKIIEEIADV